MAEGSVIKVSSHIGPQYFISGTVFRNHLQHDERYVLMADHSKSGEAQLCNLKNGFVWEFGSKSGITNLERLEVESEN